MASKELHLAFYGYPDEMSAWAGVDAIKRARDSKEVTIQDWALIEKRSGGTVKIHDDRSADPGALRGGAFGGAAGMVLAAAAGPVGLGAVAAGAAIGAITAGIHDSGMKGRDLKAVGSYMDGGRFGVMVAMPLEEAERWGTYAAAAKELAASDRRHEADIVPGHTFEDALEEYRRHLEPT